MSDMRTTGSGDPGGNRAGSSAADRTNDNTVDEAETTAPTLGDIIDVLESAYPPALAESWDAVGLVAGDRGERVEVVRIAVDATDEVVDDAIAAGAQLLLVHHPPLMRGAKTVAADTPKGRLIHRLIRSGCALYAAHTNADSARPGVNDALCERLGLVPGAPLEPADPRTADKWVFTCPPGDVERVLAAMFAAGAGEFDGYSGCAFTSAGEGRFLPGEDTNPTIGNVGAPERLTEIRAEVLAPATLRESVRAAFLEAHPYEVPAYDVFVSHAAPAPGDRSAGLGRICELPEARTLAELARDFADRLPATVGGIRAAGDPDMPVRRIAVCSGAGDSHLGAARAAGADLYITGDLRHHPVDEHLRLGPPALLDVPHWAAEFPWCAQAADLLRNELGVDAEPIGRSTDPWTIHEPTAR